MNSERNNGKFGSTLGVDSVLKGTMHLRHLFLSFSKEQRKQVTNNRENSTIINSVCFGLWEMAKQKCKNIRRRIV